MELFRLCGTWRTCRVKHAERDVRGQRQRVAIARLSRKRPPLILADEPTGNLTTMAASIEIPEIFAELHKAGATVIVSSTRKTLPPFYG